MAPLTNEKMEEFLHYNNSLEALYPDMKFWQVKWEVGTRFSSLTVVQSAATRPLDFWVWYVTDVNKQPGARTAEGLHFKANDAYRQM